MNIAPEIKRYDVFIDSSGVLTVLEAERGRWVHYYDVPAPQARQEASPEPANGANREALEKAIDALVLRARALGRDASWGDTLDRFGIAGGDSVRQRGLSDFADARHLLLLQLQETFGVVPEEKQT